MPKDVTVKPGMGRRNGWRQGWFRLLLILGGVCAALTLTAPPVRATVATITVGDSTVSDWSSPTQVTTFLTDPVGDVLGAGEYDLIKVWVAGDGTNLYARWDVKLSSNKNKIATTGYGIIVALNQNQTFDAGDLNIGAEIDAQGNVTAVVRDSNNDVLYSSASSTLLRAAQATALVGRVVCPFGLNPMHRR